MAPCRKHQKVKTPACLVCCESSILSSFSSDLRPKPALKETVPPSSSSTQQTSTKHMLGNTPSRPRPLNHPMRQHLPELSGDPPLGNYAPQPSGTGLSPQGVSIIVKYKLLHALMIRIVTVCTWVVVKKERMRRGQIHQIWR